MSAFDLIPLALRPWAAALAVLLIAGAGASGAWTAQDWRYGKKMATQKTEAADEAKRLAEVNAGKIKQQQDQRLALEARLKTSDTTHYKELSDEKKARQLVLDSLATADLRLSVLLAAGVGRPGGDGMSPATSAGGVGHGGARAELDPAHAQRIVGITGDGDDGLTALAACQGWIREVLKGANAPP